MPNSSVTVGDVEEREDDWHFAVVDSDRKARICFVFRGRKEANVSRRLMKEILARSIAMSIADFPAGGGDSPLLRNCPDGAHASGETAA